MSDQKRRFFSGNTVQQAVVSAAAFYRIEPEEVAYRKIEKKHGFLKVRRRVVIEVDPEDPRRPLGETAPAIAGELEADRPATPPPPPPPPEEGEDAAPAEERPPLAGGRRAAEPREGGTGRRDDGPRQPAGAGERREGGGRGPRRGQGGDDRSRRRREGPVDERPGRRHGREPERQLESTSEPAGAEEDDLQIIELPERPRPLAERYPQATGPLGDAAREALDRVLEVAGLKVEATVLQGDDRLEIDLAGPHAALLTAEDGELLLAIEHLLPRVIRGIAGETTAVRVDCEAFQELREERLRSLAQRAASEVRQSGRSRRLQPMAPADRRIVHLTIADEPDVTSFSVGDGFMKRVGVEPV
jgi:spoIIIJ-associated protein